MSTWQPQPEPLQQLAVCLRDTLGADNDARVRATEMLAQAKQSPDISNYLCFLFINPEPPAGSNIGPQDHQGVRAASALMLKNQIKVSWPTMSQDARTYIKTNILHGLSANQSQIRGLTGNVITEIVRVGGILSWPDVLQKLIGLVEGTDTSIADAPQQREGAMSALAKICEDNRRSLDKDYNGQRPLNYLIPKLLEFTSSPVDQVRATALASINFFIPAKSQAVMTNLDALMDAIFRLATDPSDSVKRNVCRAVVQMVEIRPDKIAPHMAGIVDYMVKQQTRKEDESQDDQDLALEAAEFWLTVGEHIELSKMLGPYLDKIVPTLLVSMVYSEDDMIRLGGEGDDAEHEDKEEDIKPVFATSKVKGFSENLEVAEVNGSSKEEGELSDDESESDEDGMFGGDDPEDKWNLRKCSAAALDVLASVYHQTIFAIIMPYLKENLFHADWEYREAAVLALGAVADGCMDGIVPHLPELVPYLLSLLNDTEPLVRQITCWTLGRYSKWAADLEDPVLKAKYFEPMMEGLLKKMLDSNKRVQEAGASAFANLEEQAKDKLKHYVLPITRQFVQAMRRYKDRNMYILYDCIQTLAEHVGQNLAQSEVVDTLMPELLGRWQKVKDENRELFPLLECLSFVVTAMGQHFKPFAAPIFARCIRIISSNLEQTARAANGEIADYPDKDFLVTSLDLLSAMIQALDGYSSELVSSARPHFFELLALCLADQNNDVRQSGYALLGDCAIYVFPQMHPYLPQILGLLITQLDLAHIKDLGDDSGSALSVVNNACWSCGEIALRQGSGMAPYIDKLFQRLLTIIQTPTIPQSITENAATALGRLGLGSCDELAPHLGTFAGPFIAALASVYETDEKDTAFRGFVTIVGRNPQAMESCLDSFFKAIARYKDPSKELGKLFLDTLVGYRTVISDWENFMATLPQGDRDRLRVVYGV